MKKILLTGLSLCFIASSFAQTQIGNAGFENWESVTGGTEPINWNSFLTCQGSQASAAKAIQCEVINESRPGSSGTKCARIWTRAVLGIKANGNVTLGRINAGSIIPNSPNSNYNTTILGDPNFSEAFTGRPDSIVFWVKYNAASGSSTARMKAALHDNYAYHDPEGTGGSANHIVGAAVLNYSPVATWTRKAVAFDYSIATSSDVNPSYILITFSSNTAPGGGSENDEVYIDDVELIYNQAPSINPDAYTTIIDLPVACNVLANDTDPETSVVPASITIVTQPANGGVSINTTTGIITYTPNSGFFGTDTFVYSACDTGIPALCGTATVTITVNDNEAPNAVSDYYFTAMDVAVDCNVLSNDTDAENAIDPTTVSISTQPLNGTVTVNATTGVISYTPNTNYIGLDSFVYIVCDAGIPAPVKCDSAVVIINVFNPNTNQQIVANDDAFSGQHDTQIACNVLANDVDPENQIDVTSVTIVTNPANGTVSVNAATGLITYTPAPSYNGPDAFSYSVCDLGIPTTCDTAEVTMTVTFLDAGIEDIIQSGIQFKMIGNSIVFSSKGELNGEYRVFDLVGQLIQKGKVASYVPFDQKSGVYLITIESAAGRVTKRVYKN